MSTGRRSPHFCEIRGNERVVFYRAYTREVTVKGASQRLLQLRRPATELPGPKVTPECKE